MEQTFGGGKERGGGMLGNLCFHNNPRNAAVDMDCRSLSVRMRSFLHSEDLV